MKSAAKSPPILNKEECFAKLKSIDQEHLVSHWEVLTEDEKTVLRKQITHLDPHFFRQQRELVFQKTETVRNYKPISKPPLLRTSSDSTLGKKIITEGKGGVIVLAGGQGSRVRCLGPKGCCEVTAVKKKTLFQLLAEKVYAAGKDVGRPLQMALMTSPLNHLQTRLYFANHDYFGLERSQVTFFEQQMWPLLDLEGNLFLEAPDQIAWGPNGNGGVFRQFVKAGIWAEWQNRGIEQINVIPIDNALADPFDYALFGFQARSNCDFAIKTAIKRDRDEKVGVLAEVDGKVAVIEYFEMGKNDRECLDEHGELVYRFANIGLYSVATSWVKAIGTQPLPLHRAKKAFTMWHGGKTVVSNVANSWKFEEFIFDLLSFAPNAEVLLCPREKCFAPLKNFSGDDSLKTVRKSLLDNDCAVFRDITGAEVPSDAIFELAPQFYYPTNELINKWKGKSFPNEEYVHE